MLVALSEKGKSSMKIAISFLAALVYVSTAVAQEPPVHGLWVWKTPTILDLPARGEALRNFCRSHQINEVYLSFSSQNGGAAEQQEIQKLIGKSKESGLTLVPLALYFKDGKAKVELGLARGKKDYDKRQTLLEKTMTREAEREISAHRRKMR